MYPHVVAVVVRRGSGRRERAPPRRWRDGDRIELDRVAGRTLAAAGNVERHRGLSVDGGEREASLVEVRAFEGVRRARFSGRRDLLSQNGIACGLVPATTTVGQRSRD
jgi:hypothetical protein